MADLWSSMLAGIAANAVGAELGERAIWSASRQRQRLHQALLLEDVILRLLDLEVEAEGRPGRTSAASTTTARFDAVYPEGIRELKGPLGVEIKTGSRLPTRILVDLLQRYTRGCPGARRTLR
jgi:hypothetical protein